MVVAVAIGGAVRISRTGLRLSVDLANEDATVRRAREGA